MYNFDATREIQISKTLTKVIKTIILCGKQCIVLRGHRKGIRNSGSNFGIFLAILKLLSETNSNLKLYLGKTLPTCFLGFKMSYFKLLAVIFY